MLRPVRTPEVVEEPPLIVIMLPIPLLLAKVLLTTVEVIWFSDLQPASGEDERGKSNGRQATYLTSTSAKYHLDTQGGDEYNDAEQPCLVMSHVAVSACN